jgi:protease-4
VGFTRRLLANGTRVVRRLAARQVVPADAGNWLDVELDGAVPECSLESFGRGDLGLLDLLRTLAAVGDDARFDGVLLRISGSLSSQTRAASIARAVTDLREAGRRVVVWAESLHVDQYLIASAADQIWLPESGALQLVGLRVERFFVRDLLERIGARPEVVHIGRFKSAGDTFTRDGMSGEEREQLEAWQDDLFAELVSGVARGRGLAVSRVEELIDRGPYPARTALEAGLIDALVYPDEIDERLEAISLGEKPRGIGARRARRVSAVAYHLTCAGDPGFEPWGRDAPRLVQLLALGNVGNGAGSRGITPDGTGALLEALRTESSVRGVLVRIDSPGGDALVSDLLHRQVERLVHEKPVVVSMGDVVASGGYYLAAAADAVFAEAGTVTGSIGVVGGKLDLSALYEKLGISKEGVQRGARAGLLSEARGFTADERAAVRREMTAIYGTFVDRVARGRALAPAEVEEIAQGRIWSGRRAQSIGLVDAIGGPFDAFRDLAERAGFGPAERFPLVTIPKPSMLSAWLGSALGGIGPFGSMFR